MATAGDEIRGALRLIGQLAEGETASAETMQDSLTAFNDMLDSWSLMDLSVFSTMDQVFMWPAGQRVRKLGPTGDFIGDAPIMVLDSTYFVDTSLGLSFAIEFVSESRYNSIPIKTMAGTYPTVIFTNMTEPDVTLTVYPVPTKNLEWHFISVTPLVEAPNLATDLIIPKGYRRAFRYNLAVELAPEFGVEPSATVQRIAASSLKMLKNANVKDEDMIATLPSALGDSDYSLGGFLGG